MKETQTELVILLANISDMDAIYEMYMDESSNPYLTYDDMTKDNFKRIYEGLIETNTVFVARSHGTVVGTYRLIPKTFRQSHIAYLGSFTVRSSYQGKGYGEKILNYIRKDAGSKGIKRIELTVSIENESAIRLYKKTGFEIEGLLKMNYKLASTGAYYDEYLMAAIL